MWRFLTVFSSICRRGGVFVDSGANEGTWSLLAAAHGCNVIAIEPQPYCGRMIRESAKQSGLQDRLTCHMRAFSDNWNTSLQPCVPLDICRGAATYRGGAVTDIRDSRFHVRAQASCEVVPFLAIDQLNTTIDLWHLDVEGSELAALRSAKRLLSERRVLRVMIEVDSQPRWRLNVVGRDGTRPKIDKTLAEVRGIFNGWSCTSACDGTAYSFPTHFAWGFHGSTESLCSNVYCVAPGVDDNHGHAHHQVPPLIKRWPRNVTCDSNQGVPINLHELAMTTRASGGGRDGAA